MVVVVYTMYPFWCESWFCRKATTVASISLMAFTAHITF